MPNIIIIAGPNGAGKSTLAPALLRDTLGILEYVNADTIAEGLSAFAPQDASFDAGRVMLGRLRELADERWDFAFEPTLASRFYAGWLSELQRMGYRVHLTFLWLENVELALERVRTRVHSGGHDIHEANVRRRYDRGLKNLFDLYLPIVNSWRIYDGSNIMPKKIAEFAKGQEMTIYDEDLWKTIKRR